MNPQDITILFLAHYAPQNDFTSIPVGIKDFVYAQYHHKVYKVLKSFFPKLLSSCDPSVMLQDNIEADFIFSLYNRMPFRNSEVFVSSVAEYHNLPYLGARPNIRALAEDKHLAKMLAVYAKVPTPKWTIYNIGDEIRKPNFEPPYFIKPRFGATSNGIDESSTCSTWEAAKNKVFALHSLGVDVILEAQIKGIYHTCPVLNNFGLHKYLPCIAQYSTLKDGVVTYQQKRKITPGLSRKVLTDNELQKQIQEYSKHMYSLIQPLDYTRFDYIVERESGIPYFLEFNVCCNLGEHSTISQAAAANDITYDALIANITYSSLYRNGLLDSTFGKEL